MAESFLLKDFIDRDAVTTLGRQIQSENPSFPLDSFVKNAMKGLNNLEFTGRTKHIASALRRALPDDIPTSLEWIVRSLPSELDMEHGMFKDNFWIWPVSDFIHDYGKDHWKEAMNACYYLTQCFTSEFAVRPHLQSQPEKTLKRLLKWSNDSSSNVRRFCSESPRPRLPWASRLDLPLDLVFPILENLKADRSKFVQKSVANHLNDLGKDHPAWLLKTMKSWSKSKDESTQWIIKRALRNLIKAGDKKALAIIGFGEVKLEQVKLDMKVRKVKMNTKFDVYLSLKGGAKKQKLLIDWIMFYQRSNGNMNPKVFKGKEIEIAAGELFEWTKQFDMTPRNTRALYPGQHRLAVQVNGEVIDKVDFELK